MKQTPLILSIISLIAVLAFGIIMLTGNGGGNKASKPSAAAGEAVQQGAIVWFDLDRVLNEYDMANDLRSVVETKVQGIQEEINRRGTKLQNDVNKFQADLDKGVLVRSVAEQRNQRLQEQQNNFNNYANQKQQEIAEEQSVMMNQIGDAINTYLQKLNEEKKYSMIISTQGSVLPAPVAVGDPSLDITDEIITGLNEEYVKNKAKGATNSADTTKRN
jgi:outer membrane protein